MNPSQPIRSFDAHIYFTAQTRASAQAMKEKAARDFGNASVRVGSLVDRKVGPHPLPMFQIQFPKELLSEMILWLMTNRLGLTVLVHQVTGNDLKDHYEGALWMGAVLALDDSQLDPSV
jgi:DOPA 4,5-dioxygenase